jgi:hypothetical protein
MFLEVALLVKSISICGTQPIFVLALFFASNGYRLHSILHNSQGFELNNWGL